MRSHLPVSHHGRMEVDTNAAPAVPRSRHRSGFWAVAFAFLIVMAFATLPSPLYGLYRTRDHLSAFVITIVFAIFAAGTIITLLEERFIAARIGRRGAMLAGVATMMVAAGLLAAWKDLPALLVGRFLTGVAIGLAAGVAIPYLIELRLRADPTASAVRAQIIGTSVNVGALGIGPLVAGILAQWATQPLTLSYLLFVALGAVALIGVAPAPETGTPTRRAATENRPAGSRRSVRLPVPAAAATIAAFSSTGLFAGLSGLFLATTFHRPSHALSGVTLFLVFSAGVVSQLATTRLRASRVLALGMIFMVVRLRHPRSAGRLRLGLGAAGTPTRRLGLNQLPEPVTPPPQAAPRLIQRGDLLASPLIKNQMKASLT